MKRSVSEPGLSRSLILLSSSVVGLLSARPSRPKGVLEDLLTPYSTSKDFKKSKDKLVRDLFELYNRTVFDNQVKSTM